MKQFEFVIKFMQNVVWGLVLQGLFMIPVGVLIVLYPNLLGILVGIFLIISGLGMFVLAFKASKYSKIIINL